MDGKFRKLSSRKLEDMEGALGSCRAMENGGDEEVVYTGKMLTQAKELLFQCGNNLERAIDVLKTVAHLQ